jgi:cell division protein FtsB
MENSGCSRNRRMPVSIELLRSELAQLEAERFALEKKTAMLRDGSLERDMIDEQARRLLGVTRSREIVILHANAN